MIHKIRGKTSFPSIHGKFLPGGNLKRIHVDRRILANNLKTGANEPAITIQLSSGAIKASRVRILSGMPRFIQAGIDSIKPLSCGARVWVETKGAVEYS